MIASSIFFFLPIPPSVTHFSQHALCSHTHELLSKFSLAQNRIYCRRLQWTLQNYVQLYMDIKHGVAKNSKTDPLTDPIEIQGAGIPSQKHNESVNMNAELQLSVFYRFLSSFFFPEWCWRPESAGEQVEHVQQSQTGVFCAWTSWHRHTL